MQNTIAPGNSARSTDDSVNVRGISLTAARAALVAASAAIVFLVALHLLSPEFDPTWRMVSEYALGNFGWVLSLMFVLQAVGCFALFFAIKSQVPTLGGKIGLVFLMAAAFGLTLAAIFDITHALHGLAALIGIPSLPIAAVLISFSLRRSSFWASSNRWLLLTTVLTWGSLGLMLTALVVGMSQTGGELTPAVLIGLPNRLLVLAYSAWIMVTARGAAKLALK